MIIENDNNDSDNDDKDNNNDNNDDNNKIPVDSPHKGPIINAELWCHLCWV